MKDQQLIDRMVLQNCKRRQTNLAMAYVDYKKAYDIIPHSWILESLQLVGAADNIMNVLEKSITKGISTSNVEYSKETAFRCSHLLFVSYKCHSF